MKDFNKRGEDEIFCEVFIRAKVLMKFLEIIEKCELHKIVLIWGKIIFLEI